MILSRANAVSLAALLFMVGCGRPPLERAAMAEADGDFKEAERILGQALQESALTDPTREDLAFELERLKRIRLDYPDTKDMLFGELSRSIHGVSEEEFERWIAEGKFDMRLIDDTLRFMYASRSNLFWRYPQIRARRVDPPDRSRYEQAVLANCRAISLAAQRQKTPLVLPKTFEVEMRLSIAASALRGGETVRAWLPIPREFPHQRDFELLVSSPPVVSVDSATSPIRSAYCETSARQDTATVFEIRYRYTAWGVRYDLTRAATGDNGRSRDQLKPFLAEGPHVQFTDDMHRLSERLVGRETDPVRIAKRFYDWIADSIQYSYAREYSTIHNLGDYCLRHRYGDCGQEAMLLITLCRMNGIPARWQSGWYTFPGGKTIHDWTELYFEPIGWVPVDPYMGIFAMQYLATLNDDERREIRDFFFGGLDQYRMAANSDHCQSLAIPKRSFRSDTVDFQRGEAETSGGNIYFDQSSYSLTIKELGVGN